MSKHTRQGTWLCCLDTRRPARMRNANTLLLMDSNSSRLQYSALNKQVHTHHTSISPK
jgi:hypothetical protein